MKKRPEEDDVNMDEILCAALDNLDDDDDDDDDDESDKNIAQTNKTPQDSQTQTAAHRGINSLEDDESNNISEDDFSQLNSMMQEMLKKTGSDDDSLGAIMQALQHHVNEELESIEKGGKKDVALSKQNEERKGKKSEGNKERPVFGPEPPPKESDVDRTINKLLNDMASASKEEPTSDFEEMMKGFDKLDTDEGDAIIDGMMQQLLAKDLMYEPMKEVTKKFPKWLEEKKDTLSNKEYEERCKQLAGLQALLHVYETEPENTNKLMNLMKEVQEYGLPPTEIVTEIAPDLELDNDGAPKINPMQDCSIM